MALINCEESTPMQLVHDSPCCKCEKLASSVTNMVCLFVLVKKIKASHKRKPSMHGH